MVWLWSLRPGDEHPVRKGWYLMDFEGKRGEPLWYKPPSRFGVLLRAGALRVYIAMMVIAVLCVIFLES